jgi:hypothetical protein
MNKEKKMLKFKEIKEGSISRDQSFYILYAKGSGVGSGIAWEYVGQFPSKNYVNIFKKALRASLKK